MNITQYGIDNNVSLEQLHNDKSWIHGTDNTNIQFTIFLITINGSQLKYSLKSINDIKTSCNILVNVIMNVSPTNKAYNEMRLRCKTKYFIQLDEDMELLPNCFDIIYKNINSHSHKNNKNTYIHVFKLIDDYLGISDPPVIYGVKIYNNDIMKNYPTFENGNTSTSSVDQLWHKQVNKDGYSCNMTNIILGYHGKHRTNFDLLLRYSKITKNIIDPSLKINRGHVCKLLRPINKLDNFNKLYLSLFSHFIRLGYSIDIFMKNQSLVHKHVNGWINPAQLQMYDIPNNYVKLPVIDCNTACSSEYIYNIDKNHDHIYCIIGILNSMFGNYFYSFDKYPYDIHIYFNRILSLHNNFQHHNIFPISYSIPEELFTCSQKKTQLVADLIPGKLETYIYNDTDSYYAMYGRANFGITHKKYGWDCLRHYEILANNCIPQFKNLCQCPKNTMITFPKRLIQLANKNINQLSFDKYRKSIYRLSKNVLTCKFSAQYLLDVLMCKQNKIGTSDVKILMLSGAIGYRNVNYSRELLCIGLRRLLSKNFIEHPQINILYKGCEKSHKYIGKGFTYSSILNNIDIYRGNIQQRICNKEFDFIIYGKVGKKKGEIDDFNNLQFWSDVSANYDNNSIVFLYGGDLSRKLDDKDLVEHSKKGICFVRELQ